MNELSLRDLRYFLAVAQELHFGRAAERLGLAQPPLSRAIRRLEQQLGVTLFDRGPRGTTLTMAGAVLVREAGCIQEAVEAARRRTQRAAASVSPASPGPAAEVVLVSKAGASHDILASLLRTATVDPDPPPVRLLLCEVGEQVHFLRDGRADVALAHRPFDDLAGLDTYDLLTEGQVALLPAGHPLSRYAQLTLAQVQDVPGLPLVRWPRRDGSYPDGPGPPAAPQARVAQLVALGQALLVVPASSRAWQWPQHVAVPVIDAPQVTTVLAWPAHLGEHPGVLALVRAGTVLSEAAAQVYGAGRSFAQDSPTPHPDVSVRSH